MDNALLISCQGGVAGVLTTATTFMLAPFSIGVTLGTGFSAVILSILFHSIIGGNDTQARFTGTFH
jgi:hypothetical protein